MSKETISIVTDDTPPTPPADTRSWEVLPKAPIKQRLEIDVQKLEQEMAHFLQVVGRLFHRAEQQTTQKPGIQLDEIELSVEISGEGKVSLIGSGAKAGGKGAITLKFKRAEPG